MRIILTLTLLMLCGMAATAQPILGPASLPSPPGNVVYQLADTTGVRPGDAGVDVVWDFTTLQSRTEEPRSVVQLTVAPDALEQEIRDQFPTADRAIIRDTLTELFEVSGFMMRIVGVVTPSATVRFAESDPYDVRPVELRYGAEHLDTHTATITPNGVPVTLNRRGEHRVIYDGWGQLLLPGWDPIQAARISMQRRTTDTLSVGPITTIITTELDRTYWADAATDRVFLLMQTERISRTVNGEPRPDTVTQRHVRWLESQTTSVDDADLGAQLQVRPHPVTGRTITVNGLDAAPATARLTSLDGRSVDLTPGLTPEADHAVIILPEVLPGLYVLELGIGQPAAGRRILRKAIVITR